MTTTDEFSEKEHDKPESGAIYFSGEETGVKLAIVRTEPISESYQKGEKHHETLFKTVCQEYLV